MGFGFARVRISEGLLYTVYREHAVILKFSTYVVRQICGHLATHFTGFIKQALVVWNGHSACDGIRMEDRFQ